MVQDDNSSNAPKKPMIYYYAIVLLVMMLLNSLLFPALMQRRVTEVSYDTFLSMVDEGSVTEVAYEQDEQLIVFAAKNSSGKEDLYKTGVFPDDGLRQRLEAAGVTFTAEIPTQNSPLLNFLLTWIFPLIIFAVVGQILMRSLSKRMGGGNAMSFGKSNAKIYAETETGKTFADVAGQDEAKDALREIVDFLHNPQKYAAIGAKLPKGALLVGPPGTGKTLLARAVAGEAHVPFFSISGSEFVEMFVGMGAAKVRDLFKQANEKAPCIVFIDEIDTIGKKRDNGAMGGNDEREQTLNQLLTEMDGFDGASRASSFSPRRTAPSRSTPRCCVPAASTAAFPWSCPIWSAARRSCSVHAKDVKMEPYVDFTAIARATSGASGAELANIINEAALRAVRMGRSLVNQSDLEESVETVIAGYQRKNAVMSPEEKKIVAYHEIGHALVAARQSHSAPVTKITIVPRTSGALGYTMQVDEGEHYLMSKTELENKIATFTGGRAAEELIFGSITTGASNDIEQATKLARAMITRYGMDRGLRHGRARNGRTTRISAATRRSPAPTRRPRRSTRRSSPSCAVSMKRLLKF